MMRRDGVEYLRCLDCDSVFEAEDLEQIAVTSDEEEEDDTAKRAFPRRKKAS